MFLQFTNPLFSTLVAVGLFVAAMVAGMLVENSRFGLALLAIRQNELAAEAAGLDTWRWKMRGLVASGAIAAAAGGLYACVLLIVTPDSVFGVIVSAQALVVTLFGGVGTVWGPVIGAAILIPLAETLNAKLGNIIPGIQGVVYGVAIIAIMLAAPEGLFWTIRDRFFRRAPRRPAAARARPHRPPRRRTERTLLDVRGLSKSFGGLRAVQDVSFSVDAGEILGIIGPNGAGKTTLFNLLNGVLRADAGAALLAGEELRGRKVHRSPPRRRAHLPGGAQLLPPVAAGERDRRRLWRRPRRSGGRRRGGSSAGGGRASPIARRAGRRTDQQGACG